MPVIIHELPKRPDKVITMGNTARPLADYYPPGATEPIVRPADVLPPASSAEQAIEPAESLTMAAAMPIPERDQRRCELCDAAFHADRIDPLCVDCRASMDLARMTSPLVTEPKKQRGRKKTVAKEELQEGNSNHA